MMPEIFLGVAARLVMSSVWIERFRFFMRLRRYLRSSITLDEARETIRARLAARDAIFLRHMRRAIFEHARSPYLPLFRRAGCDFSDLEAAVRRDGLEGALRSLKREGVHVSFEEFKGRRPIVRGADEFPVAAADFDNPLAPSGMMFASGGTSGASNFVRFTLPYMAARAPYEWIKLHMLDLERAPVALWFPKLPASTGVGNLLRYAKTGRPPDAWFSLRPGGNHFFSTATNAIVAASRGTPHPFPWPAPTSLDEPERLVDWIRARRRAGHAKCAIHTYASAGLRVCHAARAAGEDLQGVWFFTTGEPMTEARLEEFHLAGAHVYPVYASTEAGKIGNGCATPDCAGDYHFSSDTLAVIQDDPDPGGPAPMFITSMLESAPKILLNIEQGDMCVIRSRKCECEYNRLGMDIHLTRVSSYVRITAEGMSLPHEMLERLAQRSLPGRLGGSSIHFQWQESYDARGFACLRLAVDPDLGVVDAAALRNHIFEEIGRVNPGLKMTAGMLRGADTLQIVREKPRVTLWGKTPSVMMNTGPAPDGALSKPAES